MNDFLTRQIEVLRQLINSYRSEKLSLNTLIQRIQAVGEILDSDQWDEAVFPIVLSMEQINAFAIEEKKDLTEAEADSVKNSLVEFESAIAGLEAQ